MGNTVILTIIDWFSKLAHIVPLLKLPSAKETVLLILQHVFRLHRIPFNVVLDQGPQFVSAFWREFCAQMETTVSISSGFQPQSNGQTKRVK